RAPGSASPDAAWASTAGCADPVVGAVAVAPVPAGRCALVLRRFFRPPAALASLRYVLSVVAVTARPLSLRSSAMAGRPYPLACMAWICEDSIRTAWTVVTSSALI